MSDAIHARGFDADEIAKIAGPNKLRLFHDIFPRPAP